MHKYSSIRLILTYSNFIDDERNKESDDEYDHFEDLENPQTAGDEGTSVLTDEQLREKNAEEKSKNKTKIDSKKDDAEEEEEQQNDDIAKLKAEIIEQKKTRLENLEGGLKYTGFQQVCNLGQRNCHLFL